MKINVDAAVSRSGNGGALGAVCRSEDGSFMGASSLVVEGVSDPATLEALACREALALAEDLHLRRVVVATDCLSVVKNMRQDYAGCYSMVIQEVKARSAKFLEVSFKHENRRSNSEAHSVARSVVSCGVGRQVWLTQPPDGLCIPNNITVQ